MEGRERSRPSFFVSATIAVCSRTPSAPPMALFKFRFGKSKDDAKPAEPQDTVAAEGETAGLEPAESNATEVSASGTAGTASAAPPPPAVSSADSVPPPTAE